MAITWGQPPARPAGGGGRVWLIRALVPISYLLLSVIVFAGSLGSPETRYAGSIPDALESIWFLSWTAHALAHHQSLLFSHALNAPAGVNLMWNSSMPLLGVLAAPITLTAGPAAAYNVLITLALASSAWAGYAAVDHVVHHRAAAWIGGLLFGFSPFMIAQAMGHLNLVVMVYPPLVLILFDEIVIRQRHRWWVDGLLLGLLTAAQVLVFEEQIAVVALACAVAGLVAAALWRERIRDHAGHVAAALGTAAAVLLLTVGWALWAQFLGAGHPAGFGEVSNAGEGGDLLSLVSPTANQLVAPAAAVQLATHFGPQTTGQDGYIGVPLLLLIGLVVWRAWPVLVVRLAAAVAAVLVVLSLGSSLFIGGVDTHIPLPWLLFRYLPLLDNVVALRLMGYAWLPLALIVGWLVAVMAPALGPALRRRRPLAMATMLAAVVTAATLLPALPRPDLRLPPTLPAAGLALLPAGSEVLFAPYPSDRTAAAMYDQAAAGFRFSMVEGYAYFPPPMLPWGTLLGSGSAESIRVTAAGSGPPDRGNHWRLRLEQLGITRVVVTPGSTAAAYDVLFSRVAGPPAWTGDGFSIWMLGGGATA